VSDRWPESAELTDVSYLAGVLPAAADVVLRDFVAAAKAVVPPSPASSRTRKLNISLLSDDADAKFFLYLQISDPGDGYLVIDLNFRPKPSAAPPARMEKLRTDGWTAERICAAVESALDPDAFWVVVAEFRASGAVPSAFVRSAAPVSVRGGELPCSGQSFSTEARVGFAHDLQWEELDDNQFDLTVGYSVSRISNWTRIWETEVHRCREMLAAP
jgi:hypothetical protein